MKFVSFVITLAILLALAACSDPTVLGGGLLDQDQAEVGFTDTLTVEATVSTIDSVRTYSPFSSSQLTNYLLGNFNDPIFGKATSSIYAQLIPQSTNPNFIDAVVDSVVLILPYDADGFYGKTDESFGIEAFRLTESLDGDEEYYSNQEASFDPVPLGSEQLSVSLDSLEFIDYDGTDPDTLNFSFFRIPIGLSLGEELIGLDSSIYESDSLFLEAFKGLHVRPSTENQGMLSFNLLAANAGLYVFYRDSSNTPRRFLYDFVLGPRARFTKYEYDYSGSVAEPFINSGAKNDSLLFIQGMSGLETRLELPGLDKLDGVIINKAELEIYIASLSEDDQMLYPPIEQLVLTAPSSDGEIIEIEDIRIVRARGFSLSSVFGGAPLDGTNGSPMLYKMNISAYFQRIVDGEVEAALYIAPNRKAETASRVVIYGPGHPQYPIKLKVAFTRL